MNHDHLPLLESVDSFLREKHVDFVSCHKTQLRDVAVNDKSSFQHHLSSDSVNLQEVNSETVGTAGALKEYSTLEKPGAVLIENFLWYEEFCQTGSREPQATVTNSRNINSKRAGKENNSTKLNRTKGRRGLKSKSVGVSDFLNNVQRLARQSIQMLERASILADYPSALGNAQTTSTQFTGTAISPLSDSSKEIIDRFIRTDRLTKTHSQRKLSLAGNCEVTTKMQLQKCLQLELQSKELNNKSNESKEIKNIIEAKFVSKKRNLHHYPDVQGTMISGHASSFKGHINNVNSLYNPPKRFMSMHKDMSHNPYRGYDLDSTTFINPREMPHKSSFSPWAVAQQRAMQYMPRNTPTSKTQYFTKQHESVGGSYHVADKQGGVPTSQRPSEYMNRMTRHSIAVGMTESEPWQAYIEPPCDWNEDDPLARQPVSVIPPHHMQTLIPHLTSEALLSQLGFTLRRDQEPHSFAEILAAFNPPLSEPGEKGEMHQLMLRSWCIKCAGALLMRQEMDLREKERQSKEKYRLVYQQVADK